MKLKIDNAFNFATKAHQQQTRKYDGAIYTQHLIEVYNILDYANANDENVFIAGILHDTLEDTPLTAKDIEKEFGSEVLSLVLSLTDDKTLSYDARKAIALEKVKVLSAPALTIKIADLISNVSTIPPSWDAPKIATYKEYCLAVINAAKQNPAIGQLSPSLIGLAVYLHKVQTTGCTEYSSLYKLAGQGLLYWYSDNMHFVVARSGEGSNEAYKLSNKDLDVLFELDLLRSITLSNSLPRTLSITWEQSNESDEPIVYGKGIEVACQQVMLEASNKSHLQ
jgi:hypothetical protein